MACAVNVLGVLLAGFVALSSGGETCDLYAAVGQALTLPLDYKQLAMTDVLRWTHNSTIIFYRQSGKLSVGRLGDIDAAGSLHLKSLTSSSAGIYKADVLNSSGTFIKKWTGRLCLMEKVSKPRVTFICDAKANIVTFTCNVPTPQGMLFTWALDEKALTSETKQTLKISLSQLKGGNNFMCSVANKVSKEMSDGIRLLCPRSTPAPPSLHCFPRKTVVATLAGGGCLILVLIIITIISVASLCSRRRRSEKSLDDEGGVRMVPVTSQEQPESISPEYESMYAIKSSPGSSPKPSPRVYGRAVVQDKSLPGDNVLQVSSTEKGKNPSPVPKPRMKALPTSAK